MPMHLMDLRERMGPYWASYQAKRRRDRIIENPDYVPPWFLAKLARERVAAARVALQQLLPPVSNGEHEQRHKVWRALRTVEDFLREGHVLEPAVEQVVCGLLGAQEIEVERERRDYEAEQRRQDPRAAALEVRQRRERIELEKSYLRAQGYRTASDLATAQAEQLAAVQARHADQWRALDELAEEARASSPA